VRETCHTGRNAGGAFDDTPWPGGDEKPRHGPRGRAGVKTSGQVRLRAKSMKVWSTFIVNFALTD
jgi:hypothetical protein